MNIKPMQVSKAAFLLFFCFTLACSQNQNIQDDARVLALFKSSDGHTADINEIRRKLSPILAEMDMSTMYWDIDKGLPELSSLTHIRAVLAWYNNSVLADPESYLNFLNELMDAGIKVVIFDRSVVYQNRFNKGIISREMLNVTLAKLGLSFVGERLVQADKVSIFNHFDSRNFDLPVENLSGQAAYFQFAAVDRNVNIHLSFEDGGQAYPIAVTNGRGGYCLVDYVAEDGAGEHILDMKTYLEDALFPTPKNESIALLFDDLNIFARQAAAYAENVLKRAKLPVTLIRKGQFRSLLPGDLRHFTAIGLVIPDDSGLNPRVLEDYLINGGSVVSLMGGEFDALAEVLGLGDTLIERKEQRGFRIRSGFITGIESVLELQNMNWFNGSRGPVDDAVIYATDYSGDIPLVWTLNRAAGQVLYWNWTKFYDLTFEGFLLESFMNIRPVGIAATPGVAMLYIDDWPCPMYNSVKDPISMTDTEFYTNVWWPEIKQLLFDNQIPFCSCLCFTYTNKTEPPFSYGEFWTAQDLSSYRVAMEILNSGGDLALHGYNHVSLFRTPTRINETIWTSKKMIESSLSDLRGHWIQMFGEHQLPYSYVPPYNLISVESMRFIKEIIPSVKVIAAFRDEGQEKPFSTIGPHPDIDDLYCIPRNTAGYPLLDKRKIHIISAIIGLGMWSHYIHPDDIYDASRSLGLDWQELKSEFKKMLDFVDLHYPWLRFLSIRDAHHELLKFDSAGAEFRWISGTHTMEIESVPNVMLRLRANGFPGIKSIEGATVVHKHEKTASYVLKMIKARARIQFIREK